MKKIISLFIFCIGMLSALFVGAQDATVKADQVWSYTPSTTFRLSSTNTYTVYVQNWCEGVAWQLKTVTTSGKSKIKTIISKSHDNLNWTKVDSIIVNANNTATAKAYATIYAPYLKFYAEAVDSTQVTTIKYNFLINTNQ